MTKSHATPHDRFVAPARQRAEIWRLVLGVLVLVVVWCAAIIVIGGVLFLTYGGAWLEAQLRAVEAGEGPEGTFILLGLIAAAWPALWATVRLVHRRSFMSLIGPGGFRPGAFALGMGAIVVFVIVSLLPSAIFPIPMVRGAALETWLIVLVPALVLIFLQSAAEELIFRGYLQQQVAARTGSTLAAMIGPSILFGLGHYAPQFGPNTWLMVGILTMSGLIAADVTRRTGNLSFAMGLHFANNVLAILIVGFGGEGPGFALWTSTIPLEDTNAIRTALLITAGAEIATYLLILGWVTHRRGGTGAAVRSGVWGA